MKRMRSPQASKTVMSRRRRTVDLRGVGLVAIAWISCRAICLCASSTTRGELAASEGNIQAIFATVGLEPNILLAVGSSHPGCELVIEFTRIHHPMRM